LDIEEGHEELTVKIDKPKSPSKKKEEKES
jgi:hypothetical protein